MQMDIGTIFNDALAVIASLSLIVQIAPIKVNPWSTLFQWIGKNANKDLYAKIDDLDDKIKAVKDENDAREAEKSEREAKKMRSDIIRFASRARKANAVIVEWEFEDIFNIIDDYTQYCDRHNIPNHFIDEQVEFIKNVYERRSLNEQ